MEEQQLNRLIQAIEQQAQATAQLVEMIALMLESMQGDDEEEREPTSL